MKVNIIPAKSILTKANLPINAYSANPYIGCAHACKYCYASFMKRFTNHHEDWGSFVDVKIWPEIKHPAKYSGQGIFISSATDPYQPIEAEHKRTRALLEQMQGSGARISIATKSDLVLRDIDLIKSFPDARVSWSINTLDESFREEMDNAVSIERRLSATDAIAIIDRAKSICNLVWLENLNLRGDYRKRILDWIHEKHPELDSLYHEIYSRRDRTYWYELDDMMKDYTAKNSLPYVRNQDSMTREFTAPPVVVNYFFHEEITR